MTDVRSFSFVDTLPRAGLRSPGCLLAIANAGWRDGLSAIVGAGAE